MTKPVLYDSHMHTPLCKHARGLPTEYAQQAHKRGLKGIIITCHNPGPKGWSERVRMSLDQLNEYVDMVAQATAEWSDTIDVQLGLESDYIPGIEPFLEKLHKKADFNYILGSVHPQLPYYKDTYFIRGEVFAYAQLYFEHLAMAAESGLYDCLAHPDLVKNSMPNTWDVSKLLDDIRKNLDRIAQTGIAMELNTSGIHKRFKEMNPSHEILTEMKQRNIPVVLGSDAHSPSRVAAEFEEALETLADVGYNEITYYLKRQPHTINIDDAINSLLAKKPIQQH
jgi:histidinol-phosphatase (PHP family)